MSSAPPPITANTEETKSHYDYSAERGKLIEQIHQLEKDGVSLQRPGAVKYHWLSFSIPEDFNIKVTIWLQDFMGLWFKKEEVLRYIENKKKGTKKTTEYRLQKCFRELVIDNGLHFKDYGQVFAHPDIDGICTEQSIDRPKAQQYLSPVAKEIHPHLRKGGRPKKT